MSAATTDRSHHLRELIELLAANGGNVSIDLARTLVENNARALQIGDAIGAPEALAILKRIADAAPGVMATSAHFAMTRIHLAWTMMTPPSSPSSPPVPLSSSAAPPAAPAPAPPKTAKPAPAAKASSASAERVVVAVGDAGARAELFRLQMTRHGIHVVSAPPSSAHEVVHREQPDVVVIDARARNALAICRALREDTRGKLPVLMLSSVWTPRERVEAEDAGARGFLRVVDDPAEIAQQIRAHFGADESGGGAAGDNSASSASA